MFDFVRNHKRLMQLILLILIVPSFAFFGIEGYTSFMGGPQDLVKIDGYVITQTELDNAMREQIERMRLRFGGQLDPRIFDTPEARQAQLDDMIRQRVLASEVNRAHLTVSDARLQEALMSIPQIAALRKPDGSFDVQAYQQLIKSQGLTPEQFDARVRYELALQQLPAAVTDSGLVSKTTTEHLLAARAQEREIQERMFSASDFAGQVDPTAEQLKAYYDSHQKEFENPEHARVEYVVLSSEAVAASLQPNLEEIRKVYEQNQAKYRVDEQRRASHILIGAAKDTKATDRAAAKTRAEQILTEVRKNPSSFAAVAKRDSQDPGSAQSGGDLGFFGRGVMTKPFDTAVFAMKQGQISELVETDFGYHIILLTGIKPAETRSFESVRPEIEADLKRQQAVNKYNEMIDTFNHAIERSDNLRSAADKLKLQIQVADNVMRMSNPTLGPKHPLSNAKLREMLFTADSVKNRRNTEPVEVAPGMLVAARIVDYQPASIRKFEEVREQVRARVVAAEAAKLAHQEADKQLTELLKTNAATGFGAVRFVSRNQPSGLSPQALETIMRIPTGKLPTVVSVDLGNAGVALYRIMSVRQPEKIDPDRRAAESTQLTQVVAQSEFAAFVEALRAKASVKIIRPIASKAEDGLKEGKTAQK